MNLGNLGQLFKGLIPILEPLGEQGIAQLFDLLDAEVAKLSDSADIKPLLKVLSVGLRQFAITELQKVK